MNKVKLGGNPKRAVNDYRTSRLFARMLSIFGWAFLIVWLVIGLRYGIILGREIHSLLVQFVWDGTPVLLVNLFLVMWLLALVMFGFMFVVAGQGMRAVFEMANASKRLVQLAEQEKTGRDGDVPVLAPLPEDVVGEIADSPASPV